MRTITCSFSQSKSIISTAPDTFYEYPGPVFGTGAVGAVFRDIVKYPKYLPLGIYLKVCTLSLCVTEYCVLISDNELV